MAKKIATWLIRLVVAAAIYIATAAIWINNAKGWEGLGLFIAALVFGIIAAVAWCIAVAIGQFYVRPAWARRIVHPVLTAVLFAILAVVILSGFLADTSEAAWRDVRPFIPLVAVCALVDAGVDFALERALALRPVRSP